MNATPGAKNKYSRGPGATGGDSGGSSGGSGPPFGGRTLVVDRGAGGLILAGALLAALLLIVAEFTSLYEVHIATSSVPIKTVSGGSNHSYAMLLIGLAAAGLGLSVWQSGSRLALLALGVLGVVALLIALLGDLPDAHATGLSGSAGHGYVNASSTPSAGLYMETLGAVLLIATSGLGFLTLSAPRTGRPRPGGGGPGGRRGPGPGEDGAGLGPGASGEGTRGNGDGHSGTRAREGPRADPRRRRSGPETGG